MHDYIVSLVPLTVENRETAASPEEAAKQACLHKFAANMSEGSSTITIHVMQIVEEPVSIPVNITATVVRNAVVVRNPN